MMDPKLKQYYNPKTHYQLTFHPRECQPAVRPGLAVPACMLPKAPFCPMDNLSISHSDFVEKPINMVEKHKEVLNLRTPKAAFQDITSYKCDYPVRIFDPNPTALSQMRSTLPRIIEVLPNENYLTTNQSTLRNWYGNHQSSPYRELQEPPFFEGEFHDKSVSTKDFSSSAIEGGNPSTSYKKESRHEPEGSFDGGTIHKTMYKLPAIYENEPLHLKGRSQTMQETMEPNTQMGKIDYTTQYHSDHPRIHIHTGRRWMCPPHLDKLQLFRGSFNDRSEHRSSYTVRNEVPRIRTSFKNKIQLASFPLESGNFDDHTVTGTDFQPTHKEERMDRKQAASDIAQKVTFDSKNGKQMKEVHHFSGEFRDKTTNKTEYFKFWKLPPRVRYGDSSERVYHPSQIKFIAESETKAKFLPVNGKPSEICKPLDARFKNKPKNNRIKLSYETAYGSDFVPRPLPRIDVCPAEMVLQMMA